jgi:hypothetical protein
MPSKKQDDIGSLSRIIDEAAVSEAVHVSLAPSVASRQALQPANPMDTVEEFFEMLAEARQERQTTLPASGLQLGG